MGMLQSFLAWGWPFLGTSALTSEAFLWKCSWGRRNNSYFESISGWSQCVDPFWHFWRQGSLQWGPAAGKEGGAQGLAPLQAGLLKISAVAFLQVVLSYKTGGGREKFHACVFGSKYGLNIGLSKTVPYQNVESATAQ